MIPIRMPRTSSPRRITTSRPANPTAAIVAIAYSAVADPSSEASRDRQCFLLFICAVLPTVACPSCFSLCSCCNPCWAAVIPCSVLPAAVCTSEFAVGWAFLGVVPLSTLATFGLGCACWAYVAISLAFEALHDPKARSENFRSFQLCLPNDAFSDCLVGLLPCCTPQNQ